MVLVRNRAHNVMSLAPVWFQSVCIIGAGLVLEPVEKRSLFKVVRRYYYPFSGLPGLPYENRRTGNLEETPPQ